MPNRIIKESICDDEKVALLKDFEFRLWIGLITQADDAGRGDARPAIIKGRVFPLRDQVTAKIISDGLHALATIGLIALYEVGGRLYYVLPSWSKHQRIRDCKPKYPAPEEADTIINSTLPQSAASCGNSPQSAASCGLNPNPIQYEYESKSEEDSAEPQAASTPPAISLPLNDGTEYPVSVEQCQEWAGLYPAVDVIQQLRNMRGWLDANPAKRKTKRGVNAFIVRWLAKEQDKGGSAAQYGRAAKPGYGVQGHHDELNPLERAAVDRVMGPVSKGAARMQQGVQRHGDELSAFQLAAIDQILAENEKEDKT
jgi:hypothetical protein|nr:MAG TPA_asm: replisome organizer [Caudoviricetes sp.]